MWNEAYVLQPHDVSRRPPTKLQTSVQAPIPLPLITPPNSRFEKAHYRTIHRLPGRAIVSDIDCGFTKATMSARTRLAPYVCDACLRRTRRIHSSRIGPNIHTSRPLPLIPRSFPSRFAFRRTFTATTTRPSDAETLKSGYVAFPRRRLIELKGPDAPKFLQGLMTNNIIRKAPYYAAFLDARGRVLWDIFIWPQRDGESEAFLIEVDADEVEDVLKHLKRHKLRSKIQISALSEDDPRRVWATWPPASTPPWNSELQCLMEDPRAEGFGRRFIADRRELSDDEHQFLDAKSRDEWKNRSQYRLRRYMHGIAEGQREIERGVALPMDYNIDLNGGIDFRKGCYVGQELTIRTKHTGVVRKRILPVQLYPSDADPPTGADDMPTHDPEALADVDEDLDGANIKQLDESGKPRRGAAAGKLIARLDNVGLALCRLENMTPMRITAEGGTYTPDSLFKIFEAADGTPLNSPIGVRAFVPRRLKEREKALWGRQREGKGKVSGVCHVEEVGSLNSTSTVLDRI